MHSLPFPKVCFEVNKGGTPAKIMSELQRQFDEHCKKVHEAVVETKPPV
jgi:hypothetical protein